jgi:AAA domain-containing protein
MPQVVIVNGPKAAGKTAVTAELRLLLPGSVAISGDALRAFAPADARAHLGGGATYRVAGTLTRAYLELGAARVIFDYAFLRPAHFSYFKEALPAGVALNVFTLWPEHESLLERQLPPGGIEHAWREMAHHLHAMGELLQSPLTPAAAARFIHERCQAVHERAVIG